MTASRKDTKAGIYSLSKNLNRKGYSMKKITMIGLLTALTISLSTTIYAGDTNNYTGYEEIIIISSNQAVFSNRIANRLNLTSHQRAQIQKTALLANKKLNTL